MATAGSLLAHDPGISTAQGELRGGVLTLTTGFAPADLGHLLPANLPPADRWADGGFEVVQRALEAFAPELWDVQVGGLRVGPREARVEMLPGDNVSYTTRFNLTSSDRAVTLSATLIPRLPSGHRQFVVIADAGGSTLVKKLLNAKDFSFEISTQVLQGDRLPSTGEDSQKQIGNQEGSSTFLGFFRLGIEHIWTGYDHLLFLLALLIVCRSFRSTFAIVTCFTLAHSLTLAAATFNLVSIPARFVEPAIAGSIVFVGIENLLRRGREPKGRWLVTFGFGLIHGFGFASVLRDLGVGGGAGGVAMPLFAFNLGVEAGQIVVAAVTLPIFWKLRKEARFSTLGVPIVSGVVSAAGLFWLLQRTVFS